MRWTALAPIEARWDNAPAGTPGAVVTHPAGPLPDATTTVAVTVAGWPAAASFTMAPQPPQAGEAVRWSLGAHAWLPWAQNSTTTADLLLEITGPTTAAASLVARIGSAGDSPDPRGFQLDLGNDGTIELDSFHPRNPTTGLERRAAWAWDFRNGPLRMRVRHLGWGWSAPQAFGLDLGLVPWLATASSHGSDCGNEAILPMVGFYASDYHLLALPPATQQALSTLRATGLGHFGAFLVSARPDTIRWQVPATLSLPCDLLSEVLFTTPGTVTRSAGSSRNPWPMEWTTQVPLLPPGLDLHLQHASLAPPWFGVTNRVQIRT